MKEPASSLLVFLFQEKSIYLNEQISEDQFPMFEKQQDIKVSLPVTFLGALTKCLTGCHLGGDRFILFHSLKESSSPLWCRRHCTVHGSRSLWLDHLTSELARKEGNSVAQLNISFLLNGGHQPVDGKRHNQGGSPPFS